MCGEDAEVRKGGEMEAGKEKQITEKGVVDWRGHRVIDGPHTLHDVMRDVFEQKQKQTQL